jgi:hypothetical protein
MANFSPAAVTVPKRKQIATSRTIESIFSVSNMNSEELFDASDSWLEALEHLPDMKKQLSREMLRKHSKL